MKITIKEEEENIMLALGLSEDRLQEASVNAQKSMVDKQKASRLDLLESIIEQATTTEEIVAFTLIWDNMVKRAEQQRKQEAYNKAMEEQKNKLKIVKR